MLSIVFRAKHLQTNTFRQTHTQANMNTISLGNISATTRLFREAQKCFGGLWCTIDTKHMELLIHTSDMAWFGYEYSLPFRGWIHGKSVFSPSFEKFVDDEVPVQRTAPRTTQELMNDISLLLQKLNFEYCCLY